ncbi:MAG: undecaprenyl-diphosphatase UppP [Candidatus Symbiodolus clandestinus]
MILSSLLTILLLGIIEAVSEFLPISSSGHLILASHWLPLPEPLASLAVVLLQLGAIAAIVVRFWPQLLALIPWPRQQPTVAAFNAWHLIFGVMPVVLVGGIGYSGIKLLLCTEGTLVYGLLAGSLLMLMAEWLPIDKKTQQLSQLSYWQALLIGCFQCLALWPGFSRSGATIAGALLLGVNRPAAVTFSFLLAVPTMIGASSLDLWKQWSLLQLHHGPVLLVGTVTAFIVSWLIVGWALDLLQRFTLIPFAIYRLVLALMLYRFY